MATSKPKSPEQRILDAVAIMPFAERHMPRPVTLETVADYLESLVPVLTEVKRDDTANEEELGRYKADIACARRVFKLISQPAEGTD